MASAAAVMLSGVKQKEIKMNDRGCKLVFGSEWMLFDLQTIRASSAVNGHEMRNLVEETSQTVGTMAELTSNGRRTYFDLTSVPFG